MESLSAYPLFCPLSRGVAINRADGQSVQGEKDTLDRWREHYQLMLNHPPATLCTELAKMSYTPEDSSIDTSCPSLAEVSTVIKGLRSGLGAGPDNISPEMLVPSEWRDGIIVLLYKGKGSRSECSS